MSPWNTPQRRLVGAAALVSAAALGLAGACAGEYLHDPRRDPLVASDRAVAFEGDFCTPGTAEVMRPIKILIAIDSSQSMAMVDRGGSRAQAVVELLDGLPQEPEVQFAVMMFAGSTTVFLTRSGVGEFESVTSYTPAERLRLRGQILTSPARDSTDLVKAMADMYAMINRDLANVRLAGFGDESRPRYSVILLSDGQPTQNQDDELLCGDAVTRIRQLKDLADDVRVNTVHVFKPETRVDSSMCVFDGGATLPVGGSSCALPRLPEGICPLLIIEQNAERLRRMAALGGGDFRDFRNNEPVNFLSFRFGQVRRTYVFDKLVATNFSMPPGSPLDGGDTDSDGLLDAAELDEGTLPWVADTDGDGFSDGVEVHFRARGGSFTPNQVARPDGGGLDPGCPPVLRGVDSDGDGLLDCDEQIIGTNGQRIDSDNDGVPDSVEWQLGLQPASMDLDQDPDNDGLSNQLEAQYHMDPLAPDSEAIAALAYRTAVARDGGLDSRGRMCFDFSVRNIALANTLADTRDAGNPDGGAPLYRRGAGYNDILLSVSMLPGDDPTGRTLLRLYRDNSVRYPVGGIRRPVDGVIPVHDEQLKASAGASAPSP